jgi:hypothetical protein
VFISHDKNRLTLEIPMGFFRVTFLNSGFMLFLIHLKTTFYAFVALSVKVDLLVGPLIIYGTGQIIIIAYP